MHSAVLQPKQGSARAATEPCLHRSLSTFRGKKGLQHAPQPSSLPPPQQVRAGRPEQHTSLQAVCKITPASSKARPFVSLTLGGMMQSAVVARDELT